MVTLTMTSVRDTFTAMAMTMVLDEKTQHWLRPATMDHDVIREARSYRMLEPQRGGMLLDIGGNIGAVARWWLENGGDSVVTVEPEKDNLAVLEKNLAMVPGTVAGQITIVPRAAVADDAPPTMDFYLNTGLNKGAHSLRPTRGREVVSVPTVPFSALVREHRPRAVKIDIEGGEFLLLDEIYKLPDHVTHLAIEWHLMPKGARDKARDADHLLETRYGWRRAKGIVSGTAWFSMCVYRRGIPLFEGGPV